MAKTIAKIFELLLRLLLPARGRHRSFGSRRGPSFATYGADAGPRWTHAVEVAG